MGKCFQVHADMPKWNSSREIMANLIFEGMTYADLRTYNQMSNLNTVWKKLEAENTTLEKEKHRPKPLILGFHVSSRRVHLLTYKKS